MSETSTVMTPAEWRKLSKEERIRRNQRAIEVLDSFLEGDAEEQRETGEILMRALGPERSSYRKLFPEKR